ncbi:unnamed protein product [Citrullus colocynthis]|uniref:Uncharacterized protein n=1 Tax=Citrullus colocynthis TaxID=252529 RepID=A0ABP0Z7Y9_9ROSI
MFSIKVDNLDPFLDATSLFTEFINDEICVKFSPSTFSIIARYQCPPFFAMMFMPHPLFAEYSVDRNHISRISLRCFHNALLEGQSYSSMSMHLQEPQNSILLKFEPSRPSALPLHHELTFLPMEDWSPSQVSLNGKIFSIESEMFSNILTTFSVYNEVDTILITSKGPQVTFSVVPIEEIIITEEVCFVNFG